MNPEQATPASLVNIAFDTGRLTERLEITKELIQLLEKRRRVLDNLALTFTDSTRNNYIGQIHVIEDMLSFLKERK